MFGLFGSNEAATPAGMIELATLPQLDSIFEKSYQKPQLLFKHSTRCSISSMALNRMNKGLSKMKDFDIHYLDLIAHRDVSNAIASKTAVEHQSPQVIVLKEGKAVYSATHHAIDPEEIAGSIA